MLMLMLMLPCRFKQLMKDYWYVLVPVHVATSVVWWVTFSITICTTIFTSSTSLLTPGSGGSTCC